ncbi:MAG: tetratricopeptide repeat protein [Acidobacteria bacterium]|nr:tetratricopeptide repeat protein [Acidobacteriota bacterium]
MIPREPLLTKVPVRFATLAVAVAVGTGCASADRVAFSPHELRSAVANRIPAAQAGQIVVPYEATPEMVALAREYAGGESSDYARADALVRAITASHQFDVQWVPVATTVAAETLTNGHGNCLSMTSLFVGLARELGLTAFYIDASDRINDVQRDSELIVDTGHIAASVRTERGWRLVDFTGGISDYRTFRMIDDIEALAHFYNNRGYEQISLASNEGREVDWTDALNDFQLATYIKSDFARAQNNLGVAHARLGDDDAAKIAYTLAVRTDEDFAAPRHNLGNLSLRREDPSTAAYWYTLAIKLQKDNPYAHYHLGIALSQAGDIEGSIKAFEKAIALKRDYAEPRVLLAAAFRRQGRMEEAERVRTRQ